MLPSSFYPEHRLIVHEFVYKFDKKKNLTINNYSNFNIDKLSYIVSENRMWE